MRKYFVAFVIVLLLIVVSAFAQEPLSLTNYYLRDAPKIDGVLDSGEWENAQICEFRDTDGGNNYRYRTVGHIGYNSQWLFMAFECFDMDLASLKKNVKQRDGSVWDDDSIEIFLDPKGDGGSYYQFVVNPRGTQYDGCGFDSKWDCYWIARSVLQSKMWTIEIAIPLSSFGLPFPTDKANTHPWTANFFRTRHPHAADAEVTGWSPSGGNFHRPDKFGTINNMAVPKESLVLDSRIILESPAKWFASGGKLKATVRNQSPVSTNIRLSVIDLSDFKLVFRGVPLRVPAGKSVTQALVVPSVGVDPSQLQVVATLESNPKCVLASSNIITVNRASTLTAKMLYPCFRNSILSKDPDKRLWLVCDVGDADGKNLQLVTKVYPVGSTESLLSSTVSAKARQTVVAATDVSKLPPGNYQAQVELISSSKISMANQVFDFTVLPPSDFEVSFDRKRVCYVNGKPFFPMGLYHVGDAMIEYLNRGRKPGVPELTIEGALKDVADHGFNTVIDSWAMPNENYMKKCKENGLYAIAEMGSISDEARFKSQLEFANRFDNLLFWYTVDEPMGEKLKQAQDTYQIVSRNDKYRPAAAAICDPAVFAVGAASMDILIPDAYIIHPLPMEKRASIAGLRGWDSAAMESGNGTKPMWAVRQAFELKSSGIFGRPTPEELRCQAYTSIIFGSTGFIWYTFATTEPEPSLDHGIWYIPETELWPAFKTLNAELKKFSSVIIEGENIGPANVDRSEILSCRWVRGSNTYLLLVNPERKAITFNVNSLPGSTAKGMFESKTKKINKGLINETLKPLECVIYVLNNPPTK